MKLEEQMVVDAVITWVNGNDSAHKAKMNPYISDKKELNSKKTKMRYGQVNEIEFVVKSIVKNAKFVRNIFIVTDNQTPLFLKDEKQAKKDFPNILIVDHKTIFEGYNQYLPTFNSLSIESLLYKIPGLSEHFLYFNDDFLLLKETNISLLLFPEGTRNYTPRTLKELRTGAFVIACQSGVPILPIRYNIIDAIHDKKKKFYWNVKTKAVFGSPILTKDRKIEDVMEEFCRFHAEQIANWP